jgi:hypothetical protein
MNALSKKRLAGTLWPRFSRTIDLLNWNAHMLSAIREYRAAGVETFGYRQQMYTAINQRLNNAAVSYLEFGVWQGQTIRDWSAINTNPDSRFFGFDSFEGLPEEWWHGFGRASSTGTFDVGGQLPAVFDTRIKFVKGWFQETVRDFLRNTSLSHPIVVHVDCDLYSSALFVLSALDEFLAAGDTIIFDEYSSALNEYRAWTDYQRAFMRKSRCVAMSNHWSQAAFVLQ